MGCRSMVICPTCETHFARPHRSQIKYCSQACKKLKAKKPKDHKGYWLEYAPSHPKANRDGRILQHRLVMERHLGRPLSDSEVVHHINLHKKDNRITNLYLFPSQKEHGELHGGLILLVLEAESRVRCEANRRKAEQMRASWRKRQEGW